MATVVTPQLPGDQTLEGVVLGLALTNPAAAVDIIAEVDGVDFHSQLHQVVYSAMRSLCDRGLSVDSPSVVAELKSTGDIDRIGGVLGDSVAYIRGLAMAAPPPVNVGEYVAKLRDLSLRRELITQTSAVLSSALDMSSPATELVDRAAIKLSDLSSGRRIKEPVSVHDLASSEFSALETRKERGSVIGIPTGFADVDAITGGLEKKTLTLIAARPGVGKSAYAGCMAVNVARHGREVLIFSLEMSASALFRRMISAEARVSSRYLRSGQLVSGDIEKAASAIGRLASLPLCIDEDAGLSEVDIRSRARRHKLRHGLSLVVVDHVQLVRSDRRERTRDIEVGNVSWGLKCLAKELDVSVVALCQLNRSVEARAVKARKPTLSDLRDSGNLEQNADVVLGLYREGYYNPSSDRKRELDVSVLKNREGETGSAVLLWDAKSVRFDNLQHGAE